MGKYCITAANHKNPNNHCASQFKVWESVKADNGKNVWNPIGSKSLNFINDLMAAGHEVLSGKENEDTISTGAPVESELRIAKNETKYKISEMPKF